MENIITSLAGLGSFAAYFISALVLLFVFKLLYTLVTPHDEWTLIKDGQNTAAAIAFGGAVLGFCVALAGAIANSETYIDFLIWAAIALLAQLLAFAALRFTFMPKIAERIENAEMSAGTMLASVSVGVGLLNAACMTY
ncbi:MAG: DUF350 domain-containing protein [Glaciecola sp.]|jgi:putative membrane protein